MSDHPDMFYVHDAQGRRTAFPRVMCAMCDKQVHKITVFDNPMTRDKVVEVECHGETDRAELSTDVLRNIEKGLRFRAYAFSTPRLEHVKLLPGIAS